MASLADRIRRHFEFLVSDFGFAEVKLRRSKADAQWTPLVVYANKTTAVRVSYDVREADCSVALYQLEDGEVPSDAKEGLGGLPLPAIVELVKPDQPFGSMYYHSPEFDDKKQGLDRYLEYHAKFLRSAGRKFLRGDFSRAPEVEAVLDRWLAQEEAEEARNEESRVAAVGFDLKALDIPEAIRKSFHFLVEDYRMREVRRKRFKWNQEWEPGVLFRNADASVNITFLLNRAKARVKLYAPQQAHDDDTLLGLYGYHLDDILVLEGDAKPLGSLFDHLSKSRPPEVVLASYLDSVAARLHRAKKFLKGDFSRAAKLRTLELRRERLEYEQALRSPGRRK